MGWCAWSFCVSLCLSMSASLSFWALVCAYDGLCMLSGEAGFFQDMAEATSLPLFTVVMGLLPQQSFACVFGTVSGRSSHPVSRSSRLAEVVIVVMDILLEDSGWARWFRTVVSLNLDCRVPSMATRLSAEDGCPEGAASHVTYCAGL